MGRAVVHREPGAKDAAPIEGVGRSAVFQDPEGNMTGIIHRSGPM